MKKIIFLFTFLLFINPVFALSLEDLNEAKVPHIELELPMILKKNIK